MQPSGEWSRCPGGHGVSVVVNGSTQPCGGSGRGSGSSGPDGGAASSAATVITVVPMPHMPPC